jgi:hypothetical protein
MLTMLIWSVCVLTVPVSADHSQTDSRRAITHDFTPLFSDSNLGQNDFLTELHPGVCLTLLDSAEGRTRVQVDAWQQEDSQAILYARVGKRIIIARLKSEDSYQLQPTASVIDPDTDQEWTRVILEGWIQSHEISPNYQQFWDEAQKLYGATCSTCHPLPETTLLTANAWPGRLKAMKQNINLPKLQ